MNKISHHLEISSQLCGQCSLVPSPPASLSLLAVYGKAAKGRGKDLEDGYGYSLNGICCWVHEEASCNAHVRRTFVTSYMHTGLMT